MANLYITEQNSILRKTGDRLIVQKDDEILLEVQCHKIDAVLIFGNVQFTTQAVHELFEHGIEMAILTRTGKLIGQITSPMPKNITLRIDQFRRYWDEGFRLRFSKSLLQGKIKNCIALIRGFLKNHSRADFKQENYHLNKALENIEASDSIGQLLGIEGMAARRYFNVFAKMILVDFEFHGRRKHPATDPVNALLSLSYTMLYNEIASLLDGIGFDPYLGYYHDMEYGRASLSSDLVEEFRAPVGDRITLNLFNNKILNPDDFYENKQTQGIYLKHESLKRYFAEYEGFLNQEFIHPYTAEATTFRKCFRIQAESLAKCIKEDTTYVPYLQKA